MEIQDNFFPAQDTLIRPISAGKSTDNMRKTTLQHVQRLARIPRLSAPRNTWICANCRRAALQNAPGSSSGPQRHFTSSVPLRQEASAAASSQHEGVRSQAPQTHYDFFPETFPNGPPPRSPFTPDLKQLRREFLQRQAKTHPDLAPADQKRQAEATSMRINEAYKALQDPLKRAQYLLSLRGVDVEDESAKLSENALLMEVMEAREAVEEVEDEEGLASIREENNGRIDASVRILETAFAGEDVDAAAQEAIRLRYWMNIEESIHGWEKGKGGGVLHH